MKRRSFEQLLERAASQHGFVRPTDADDVGVSKVYLRKLASVGRAEHRGHGLYRITALPVTPLDEYHEAVLWAGGGAAIAGQSALVLWAGGGAAIAGQSALALWELGDLHSRQLEVVVPAGRRVRRKNPGRYRVLT